MGFPGRHAQDKAGDCLNALPIKPRGHGAYLTGGQGSAEKGVPRKNVGATRARGRAIMPMSGDAPEGPGGSDWAFGSSPDAPVTGGDMPPLPRNEPEADATPPARSEGVGLLDKACDVLDAVSAAPGGIGQTELAVRLGLSRTTLYRILAALVDRGLIRQDPIRRVYAVGFRLLEMAQGACSVPDLPAAAAPELRALRDLTGETAYLAVLEGHCQLNQLQSNLG